MCEFCEEKKSFFEFDELDKHILILSGSITKDTAFYSKMGVFIDRGLLRYVQLDDCGCMDHGERIKINFCPMCGEKLNK